MRRFVNMNNGNNDNDYHYYDNDDNNKIDIYNNKNKIIVMCILKFYLSEEHITLS